MKVKTFIKALYAQKALTEKVKMWRMQSLDGDGGGYQSSIFSYRRCSPISKNDSFNRLPTM